MTTFIIVPLCGVSYVIIKRIYVRICTSACHTLFAAFSAQQASMHQRREIRRVGQGIGRRNHTCRPSRRLTIRVA